MTNEQRLNIINHASTVGTAVMLSAEMACVDAIEKEDLENEDAEKVIDWYLVAFKKDARAIMRHNIIRRLNEKR